MNLSMVLHLANMNRNSFNTLERRTGLPFMKQMLVNEGKRDRYTLVHSAALTAMQHFQAAGVDAKRAADVTSGFMGAIDGYVFSHEQVRADSWLTLINFSDGTWGWASGDENADTFGGGQVASKVSINMAVVWKAMADRLGAPAPEGCEDAFEVRNVAEVTGATPSSGGEGDRHASSAPVMAES